VVQAFDRIGSLKGFLPGSPVYSRRRAFWPALQIRHSSGPAAGGGASLFTVLIPKGKGVFFDLADWQL
jgi:hypothetical protein